MVSRDLQQRAARQIDPQVPGEEVEALGSWGKEGGRAGFKGTGLWQLIKVEVVAHSERRKTGKGPCAH